MVLVKVKPEEKEKVFEILSTNGKFMGLSENRFKIIEHVEKVLEKLRDAGIEPEILD